MTLAELLVALTLLGMLSLMMTQGLRFGIRSWERTDQSSGALNATVRIHEFLRKHLSETMRPDDIHGDGERLVFTALWLTALGGAGLFEFEVSRDAENSLLLSWKPAPADDEDEIRGAADELRGERKMLDSVTQLEITYFGQPAGYPEPEWVDRWDVRWGAPSLVRMRVESAGPEYFPTLTVAVVGSSGASLDGPRRNVSRPADLQRRGSGGRLPEVDRGNAATPPPPPPPRLMTPVRPY